MGTNDFIGFGAEALKNLTDRIARFTANSYDQDKMLWSILSALRGPDIGDNVLKNKFTGPIRAWISKDWNNRIGSSTESEVPTSDQMKDLIQDTYRVAGQGHYINHIGHAYEDMIKITTFEQTGRKGPFDD